MNRRVLVTGGAGFIGSHVADAFLAAGWEVAVLDDFSRGREANLPRDVEIHRLDIRSAAARELTARGGFEVICHHAAQIDVRVSVSDPVLDAQLNIVGLLNLLMGAREGGVRRVLLASSGGTVYGAGQPPFRESDPKLPVSPYGVAKLSSEYYLAAFGAMYGLEYVSLRYTNVYGPRQDPHGEAGVVAIFCNRLRNGSAITIFGDGSQTRDYVYVEDVARANVLAAEAKLPGSDGSLDACAFNIGTGTETSVVELARALMRATGRQVAEEYAPPRTGELQANSVINEKARRVLGWRPEVDLITGLGRTAAHIFAEGD
ncbi:MAG TPA: NAD-dependent epimerase/dehydratase family protein [Gemmatimonadales bacterium]|nr:NAD-dependent epimerase/dehydratase family protein [Gemmatimonadales bacterium]